MFEARLRFWKVFSSLRGKVFSTIAPLDELKPHERPWSLVLAEAFTRRVPYPIRAECSRIDGGAPGVSVSRWMGYGVQEEDSLIAPLLHHALL
jgi:hypothetical protein